MSWNDWYQSAKRGVADFALWGGAILLLISLIGLFSGWREWGNSKYILFIRENSQAFWLVGLSIVVFGLFILTLRLRQQIIAGYSDNFSDLDGWDFEGWRLAGKGTLVVTGSDAGGITKVGSHWENYSFTFKARIINKCLGVIVRANDLNNYYMFQIRADKVRPHRRVTVPMIISHELSDDSGIEPQVNTVQHIEYKIIWQMDRNNTEFESIPISQSLNDWFDIKIIVRGRSVFFYINNKLEFERPSFLQIPTGRVGFRNNGNEEAYVKNVKVRLII